MKRFLLLITFAFSVYSLFAQVDLGTCEGTTYSIIEDTCSSGFLEFTVTSNGGSSSGQAITVTFPGGRTVEKTGWANSTKSSATETDSIKFENILLDNPNDSCTFRTLGCDPISVNITTNKSNCNLATFNDKNYIFLNKVTAVDPCNCNNTENIYNPDGSVQLFQDSLIFTGNPGDMIACTSNCGVILDNSGTAQDFGALGLTIPMSGTLSHSFYRVPGVYASTTFNVGGLSAILDAGNCDASLCNNNIPTLGQWGLIILGLFVVIFGILGIQSQQKAVVTQKTE